jgi:hypothetical protein
MRSLVVILEEGRMGSAQQRGIPPVSRDRTLDRQKLTRSPETR